MRQIILAATLFFSQTLLASDAPVGRFSCEGSNFGGTGHYMGTVEVTATGETFKVVWQIAGQTHVGTGFMQGDVFAVAYNNGQPNHHGLAIYTRDGGKWYGRWTEGGSDLIGLETWKNIDR
jgi:hypothetical protein